MQKVLHKLTFTSQFFNQMPPKRVRSKKAKAKILSKEEIEQLKKEFDSIDADHSGELDLRELKFFMNANNLEAQFANLALKLFDKDGNGQISFDEFVEFTKALSQLDKDPIILQKMLFSTLDKDGSGDLDAKEIYSFLNYFSPEPITQDDVDNIVENLDEDGDGKLSFDEIMKAFQQ